MEPGEIFVTAIIVVVGLFMLIGYIFLSYNWWDDCPPNNGKPFNNED